MKEQESKPRIVLLRKWDDGEAYYKCEDKKWIAFGSTPEEAFEMWKIISGVKEWKAQGQSGRRTRPHPSAEWIRESIKEGSKIEDMI